MAIFTNANLTATIPQIWSYIINEAKFPQFVLQNFVTDLSPYMTEGGRIVHVPNIYTNVFTATTQATQGTDIITSAQAPATVDVTLTVNTHQYVSWVIGDADMAQLALKYQLNEKYAVEAKRVLLQALEDALFALYTSITTTAVGGATPCDDLRIRQAIATLDSGNFEADQTAFFFHPVVYWNQLAGLSKIAPNYSSNLGIIASGTLGSEGSNDSKMMGRLYGRPVYMSSRVPLATTYKNLFLHKSAFGYAVQDPENNNTKVRIQVWNERRLLSTVGAVDMRYGVAVLRGDAGVVILTDTTNIA